MAASNEHPLGWIRKLRHEPTLVSERLKQFCDPPNKRVEHHQAAAALYIWPELPEELRDLSLRSVFAEQGAAAELSAKLKALRDGWPGTSEDGAA